MFFQFLFIIILTVINAFFAATELAVLSVNRMKLALLVKEGNLKAKRVDILLEDQTKFLSTIQVGITLAGFFSSALAAVGVADDVGAFLTKFGFSPNIATSLATLGVTLLLSYFTLVFGELFPKRLALRFPEKIAMFAAGPILVFRFLTTPFVKLLTISSNILARLFGLHQIPGESISEEEIIAVIEDGVTHGALSEDEQKMIKAVFKFNDIAASSVMTPRVKVFMINIDDPLSHNIDLLLEEKYSRVPVFEGEKDNIIGILYLKDLLIEGRKIRFENLDLRKLLRPELVFFKNTKINVVFTEMKRRQAQIAILRNESGGFSGIITMEDLLEEIVGAIQDEYDEKEVYRQVNDNHFILDGATPILDLVREFNIDIEKNENYDTIAGYIISKNGGIVSENLTQVTFDGAVIIPHKINKNCIETVEVILESKKKKQEEVLIS